MKQTLEFYREFLKELHVDCLKSVGYVQSGKIGEGWFEWATHIDDELKQLDLIIQNFEE